MRKLICLSSLVLSLSLVFFGSLPAFAHQQVKSQPAFSLRRICGNTAPGTMHCDAIQLMTNSQGLQPNASGPTGLNPTDLQSAYNLPSSSAGSGQTVAIVDAYNDPNAASDLAVYRNEFGLPACTTANGCFTQVGQSGTSTLPKSNASWSEEISLDLDMVSAICPNCNILLVEASSTSNTNLGKAVDTAVNLGANVVSNSYGGDEDSTESNYASYYDHSGVVITASSGDDGYGVEVPAAYNTVVSVGGTSLSEDSSTTRGWSETAWSDAGSGCSTYISKPSWQTDEDCSNRTVADVSAVADPDTGVSVYDSYGSAGGWLVFGGTSASSPIVASVYALAENASSIDAASSLYSDTADLNDVTSGSNGSCGDSYLCTAGTGYDGPTGLGTPNGVGAF